MTNSNAVSANKALLLNSKAPQNTRIRALRWLALGNCPRALLRRLIDDPTTPGRLSALAVELLTHLEGEALRKKLRKQNESQPS